jgi:hypothetical protein
MLKKNPKGSGILALKEILGFFLCFLQAGMVSSKGLEMEKFLMRNEEQKGW